MDVTIRPAVRSDLQRINDIHNGYVDSSHISFDLEPWSPEQRELWWRRHSATGPHRVLVAEADGNVVGFSSSGPYREKAAYRSSVETTVVVDPAFVGRRVGTRLLSTLLRALSEAAVHRAVAVVALPNEASIRLHESLGYRQIGVLDEVGYKFGRFWSTAILERRIADGVEANGPKSSSLESGGVRTPGGSPGLQNR